MVEQAVALSAAASSRVDDMLPPPLQPKRRTDGGRTLADVVDAAERQAIEAALRECDGSRERAAEVLGISATTLWRKMTRLGDHLSAGLTHAPARAPSGAAAPLPARELSSPPGERPVGAIPGPEPCDGDFSTCLSRTSVMLADARQTALASTPPILRHLAAARGRLGGGPYASHV